MKMKIFKGGVENNEIEMNKWLVAHKDDQIVNLWVTPQIGEYSLIHVVTILYREMITAPADGKPGVYA